MIIIGFGHERYVGKDSAAKFAMSFLRQKCPKLSCQRFSFGDQVKDVAHKCYGWAGLEEGIYYENQRSLKEVKIPVLGKSPRDIWEELGFALRKIHKETLVRMSLADLDSEIAFCTDIRHPNEIELIRDFPGSKVFKIVRDSAPKVDGAMDDILKGYPDWDGWIINNGTLKEFHDQVLDKIKGVINERFALTL